MYLQLQYLGKKRIIGILSLFLNPEMDKYLLFYLADFNKILIMYNKQNYD